MRLPRCRTIAAQINMTPMIDVTFQLIIFFLLSSRLAQQESLELELPAAASGTAVADDTRPRVTVSVSSTGRVQFEQAEVRPVDMAQRLKIVRDHWGKDLEIRVRADRTVSFSAVEPILLACADADIWNVTFAVIERAESQESSVEGQKP